MPRPYFSTTCRYLAISSKTVVVDACEAERGIPHSAVTKKSCELRTLKVRIHRHKGKLHLVIASYSQRSNKNYFAELPNYIKTRLDREIK